MSLLSILVVEDDPSFALELEMMINELGYHYLGNPQTSNEAFKAIASKKPDLIIMDINIQNAIDGISIAENIQSSNIPIIFITGFESTEYFERAKKLQPAGYLVKPFHLLTLRGVIEKALIDYSLLPSKTTDNSLLLKSNNTFHKVLIDNILWIQVDGNYCYFFTEEKKFVHKLSMKRVLNQINEKDKFLKIHRKYAIHKSQLKNFDSKNNTIHLNEEDIPVGRNYRNKVMEFLKES